MQLFVRHSLSFGVLVSLFFSLSFTPLASHAAETAIILKNSTPTLTWSLENISSCYPDTDYPFYPDGVKDAWTNTIINGPGSKTLPAIQVLGTYNFYCTYYEQGYTSLYDIATLIIHQPEVSITPVAASGINIGQSITYSSTASDTLADIDKHHFDWLRPGGNRNLAADWNWGNPNPSNFYGTTDVSAQLSFANRLSHSRSVTFTPNAPGIYTVRFSAHESNNDSWTTSSEHTFTVCDADHRWVSGACRPIVKINSFTYLPTSSPDVDKGETARLSWNTTAATSCSLSGGEWNNYGITSTSSGNITTSILASSTNYTLTCQGIAGPASSTLLVPVASGSLTLNGTTCYIPIQSQTCAMTLSWTSSLMSNPRVTNESDVAFSTLSSSPSFSYNVGYGTNNIYLKNGSYIHATVAATGECVAGSSWNGSTCAPNNNDPIGNFEGGSCTVTGWACDSDNFATPIYVDLRINGTSIGTPLANITRDAAVGSSCGGNRVHGFSFDLPGGYQNGTPVSVTAYAINTPEGNNPSIGTQSVTCLNPSGTLTIAPTSCVIASGASTCTVGATWSTTNAPSPSLVDTNTGSTLSTLANQASPLTLYASYPSTTYALRNENTTLATRVVTTSCAGGSVWNGTICSPTPNVTIGSISASPTVANYGQTSTLSWTGVANATACRLHGGSFNNFSVGTGSSGSQQTNNLTANTLFTLTCEGPGGPVSSSVTVSVASGDISASPTSCIIPSGQSVCSLPITWTTTNMSTPRVTDANDTTLYTGATGSGSASVPFGVYSVSLKNGSFVHETITLQSSCINGTAWNGAQCQVISSSGNLTLSSQSCTILTNQSTCTVNGTWTTTNASSPSLIDNNTGTTLSTNPNQGTPFTLYASYGGTEFRLRDGVMVLDAKVVTPVCENGTSWNGSVCVAPSPVSIGSLIATPNTLNYGEQASLSWSMVQHATSCRLSGGQFLNEDVGNASSGSRTTNALQQDTTYTLSCEGVGGPVSSSVTVKVASGNISASPSLCTIEAGASSCVVALSWQTQNMQNPRVTDAIDSTLSTNANGVAVPQTINYGNNTFVIKNGSISHNSVLVNGVCDGSSKWNGSVCAKASATINSTQCVVAKNASTCSVNVIWTTQNTASQVSVTRDYDNNSVVTTGTSGNYPISIPPGSYILNVRQGVSTLASGTYRASCQTGSAWNGSICQETTNVTLGILDASPSTVNYGQSATLSWNGVANATGCSLNGGQYAATSVGTDETGSTQTNPLTVNTTYTLTCEGPGGPKTSSVTVLVASGSITTEQTACVIKKGESSCRITLSWTSSNMVSPAVTDQLGGIISVAKEFTSFPVLMAYGQKVFSLKNISFVHDATPTITADCEVGTEWDGNVCASASGSINTGSCEIEIGNSSCSIQVIWSATNNGSPVALKRADGSTLSSLFSGNIPVNFSFGEEILTLTHNGENIASGSFIATCKSGSLWSGTLCGVSGVSGNLEVSSNECTIPVGGSQCFVTATWTTSGATNPNLYNQTVGGSPLSTEQIRATPLTLRVSYPRTRFDLRDGTTPIDFETIQARCASGGWDTESGTCVNPTTISALVTGQYNYSGPGNIAVSCGSANKYRIEKTDGGFVASGNYTPGSVLNVPVSVSGNYSVYCLYGDYKSTPVVRYFSAGPPPSPTLTLSATPRTVSRGSNATVFWSIQHPKNSCILEAKTLCLSGVCNQNQQDEERSINEEIVTGVIDVVNVQGALTNAKTILNSLRTIPPERRNTDWKTEGKKTFNINYSTEFVLRCGDDISQSVRVQVTKTGEQ